MYRVVRSFLREHLWPQDLSIAVLSAEHGLMGGLTTIESYDRRMTSERAAELQGPVARTLQGWRLQHSGVELVLGQDYLPAIERQARDLWPKSTELALGPIGRKLHYLNRTLRKDARRAPCACDAAPRVEGRPVYFLPDWDDFVDVAFDFKRDRFSTKDRASRKETHCSALVKPARLADGILVSLAQSHSSKGLLRALEASSIDSLAPTPVKRHYQLADDQWAFGDCGAFSYVNEEEPTISVEQAVATYELYGFDLGASVDHIPVPMIVRNGKPRKLSRAEQTARTCLTKTNARRFLEAWRARECRFHPVGVVQGLSPVGYAGDVIQYVDFGYRRIALGGLVPKSDDEILAVVKAVATAIDRLRERPWLHLMGVYRPKLQAALRALRVDSFDSATYFRKAWLRSDQNYLGADGQWYAAIRVPPSTDPRTAQRLADSGASKTKIARLERAALSALRGYAARTVGVDTCLDAVLEYDELLARDETDEQSFEGRYRRTLEDRPWERCSCHVCKGIGIHALIFRGLNRNKRRGAHNTLMLYRTLCGATLPSPAPSRTGREP